MSKKLHHGIWIATVFAATAAAFWLGVVVSPQPSFQAVAQPAPLPEPAEDYVLTAGTFRRISQKARPAVVSITSSRPAQGRRPQEENPNDFFEWFFGPERRNAPQFSRPTIGSGVIISASGEILTNYHVVEGAGEIQVALHDGRTLEARVIGRDPDTDLALIQVEDGDLPYLDFGDSDRLEVGDWVMAIGNPFEFGFSVTVGVVSAKEREINQGPYDDFIQTDAAINPGNSGGPLLDLGGRIVGINTAIITGGFRQSAGIGFAIPAALIREILPQLRSKGRVDRGFLGVFPQDMTKEFGRILDLPVEYGAVIAQVDPGTPAAEAGLQKYDVIVAWNSRAVRDSRQLRRAVAATAPGEKATATIYRDGKKKSVTIRVAQRPSQVSGDLGPNERRSTGRIGIEVQTVTQELAERLDLEETKGVFVTSVEQGSVGQKAGLRRGDVILEVDREEIDDVRGFARLIDAAEGETTILRIRRGSSTLLLTVPVPEK